VSIEGGADGYLSQLGFNSLDQYSKAVAAELTGAFKIAFEQEQPGLPATTAFARATSYANARTAELISADGPMSLTRLARADLTRIIGGGLERGDSLDSISRAIRESGAYSKSRASTIARTETSTAIGHGAMSAAREVGSKQKSWLSSKTQKVCEDCAANASQRWIGISDYFISGSSTIPAHPNCECDVIYRGEQISGIDASEGLGGSEDEGPSGPSPRAPSGTPVRDPEAEAEAEAEVEADGFTSETYTDLQKSAADRYYLDYEKINGALRGKGGSVPGSVTYGLDQAIAGATSAEEMVVHRGMNLSAKELEKFKVGRVMYDPAYLSTTSDYDVVERFTGGRAQSGNPEAPISGVAVTMSITVPPGTSALPMDRVLPSGNRGESEILFGRGTKLLIESVKTTPEGTSIYVRIVK